jgi:hypothetical protein
MPKVIDLAGQKFGRLTALEFVGHRKVGAQSKRVYRCRCECGKIVDAVSGALTTGNVRSCGCLLKDVITKHGAYKTAVYKVWHAMIQRCRNPNDPGWSDYGGRGIAVCASWLQFANFIADMGERPKGGTLDRIDVNGPYSPTNCRWASSLEQVNNRRNNRRIAFQGEELTISEWARRAGLSTPGLTHRLDAGWRIEDALTRRSDRSTNNRQSGLLLPKLE